MTDTYRAKRVSLQVWIDPETRDKLKHLAIERHQSVTEIIRALVEAELAKGPPGTNPHTLWITSDSGK